MVHPVLALGPPSIRVLERCGVPRKATASNRYPWPRYAGLTLTSAHDGHDGPPKRAQPFSVDDPFEVRFHKIDVCAF